ncbi:hypothetical protein BUMB_00787 [Candidatus Paraburkholderia calva]|nr:hypothetical protein BUMB_00787 [Candidatus Paraburkholderia calva]
MPAPAAIDESVTGSEMKYPNRETLMDAAACYRERAAQRGRGDATPVCNCSRGHAWDVALDVAQNVRCMNCASHRRTTETARMRDIARARGGVLESLHFVDAATPLAWQCAYGHRWSSPAFDAERHWCTECARAVFAAYR